MKRQKIRNMVSQRMRASVFGSTDRTDKMDEVEDRFHLSSNQIKAACLFAPGRVNFWVR